MPNIHRLQFQKVYLFDKELSDTSKHNSLKEFIYFLKFSGKRGTINFSYASNIDSIHKSLTIIENLLLDAVPMTLVKEDEEFKYFEKILEQINNPHIFELIDIIGDLGAVVSTLSTRQVKLVTIVKAILSQSDFIFFVSPEESLEHDEIKLVKSCIDYESNERNRCVLIKSSNNETWVDIATSTISKTKKDGYVLTANGLNVASKKNVSTLSTQELKEAS